MKKPIFTGRQLEISDMIAQDLSIREIATLLNCSDDNIKAYRQRIRREIGLKVGESLKKWLWDHGWDEPEPFKLMKGQGRYVQPSM